MKLTKDKLRKLVKEAIGEYSEDSVEYSFEVTLRFAQETIDAGGGTELDIQDELARKIEDVLSNGQNYLKPNKGAELTEIEVKNTDLWPESND